MPIIPYDRFVEACQRRKRVRSELDMYVVEGPDGEGRKVETDGEQRRDPECGTELAHGAADDDDPDVI